MTDKSESVVVGYTTRGPVCGECGHLHQYRDTAEACVEIHRDGCRRQGGYSDRRVVPVTLSELLRSASITGRPVPWRYLAEQGVDLDALADRLSEEGEVRLARLARRAARAG